jgi:hypothetical protein
VVLMAVLVMGRQAVLSVAESNEIWHVTVEVKVFAKIVRGMLNSTLT